MMGQPKGRHPLGRRLPVNQARAEGAELNFVELHLAPRQIAWSKAGNMIQSKASGIEGK